MRILILDTNYDEPLKLIYERHEGLGERSFEEQAKAIYEFGFARANFLPTNLCKLGHEAQQFIVNCEPLQRRWAREHDVNLSERRSLPAKAWRKSYAGLRRLMGAASARTLHAWERTILISQVEAFQPEVVVICDVAYLPYETIRKIRSHTRLLVGEMAYPVPKGTNLSAFDLILSAAPHFVESIRNAGIKSEFLPLGFEASILDRLDSEEKTHDAVFIGSVSSYHEQRARLLEEVNRRVPLTCWGYGGGSLAQRSSLRVHDPIWGYDMYRQLQRAKVALNVHIDLAGSYAGNMRLYEATGVGTLLVTDWKTNLHEFFEPGTEVVTYQDPAEAAELIAYYLAHDEEREAIARAGQQRTMRDHTYYRRMQEFTRILEGYF
jgi:spore maturation protein CgeB